MILIEILFNLKFKVTSYNVATVVVLSSDQIYILHNYSIQKAFCRQPSTLHFIQIGTSEVNTVCVNMYKQCSPENIFSILLIIIILRTTIFICLYIFVCLV